MYVTILATKTLDGQQFAKGFFVGAGYHWVIHQDGKLEKLLDDDQRGNHTAGHNSRNIGIAYVGGVRLVGGFVYQPADTRTAAQQDAMLRLARTYITQYPGIVVLGQRDWPTVREDWPCFDVHRWLLQNGVLSRG